MGDFWVKLHSVKTARLISHTGNWATVSSSHYFKTWRQGSDLVAMAHPHLKHAVAFRRGVILNAVKQSGMATCAHISMTKLTFMAAFYLATQLPGHGLHTVTNAQNRQAQLKDNLGNFVGGVFVHTGVAT